MKKIINVFFPAAYGVLCYATVRLLQDTQSGFRFWRRPLLLNLLELGLSVLVGYLCIILIRKICSRRGVTITSNKRKAWSPATEIAAVASVTTIAVNAILTPMVALTDDGLSLSDFVYINTIPLLFMLIYYGWLRSGYFLNAYVGQQVLMEKITNDRLATELKFLKAQYHPHFLFNALNTVYFQMDEDVPAAKKNLEKLAELLRYQLYDQQEKTTMGQELQYLQNFIDLQKTRISDRLQINIETTETAWPVPVYPLLFLPLVENAFKYVNPDGQIHIGLSMQQQVICFSVTNTLPIKRQMATEPGGIGLENLRRRLELLYPMKHILTITNNEKTFTATLNLESE